MNENNQNLNNEQLDNAQPQQSGFGAFCGSVWNGIKNIGKTLWRWTKRMFMGASKELSQDEVFAVERLESPGRMAVKSFFRRKIALVAFIVLMLMFLFVFIGPLFITIDLNATDAKQKNVAPNYTLMSVPVALRGDIKSISGTGSFTLGLSNAGKLYVWGDTRDRTAGVNHANIPKELNNTKVLFAAAGQNHSVAITEEGKVVCWGINSQGQFGNISSNSVLTEPQELIDGTIDVSNVKQLVCGQDVTAIVMNDGSVYAWGNLNTVANIAKIAALTNVEKIVFSDAVAIALLKDGTLTTGGGIEFTLSEINAKKVVDVAATSWTLAAVTADGSILISGTTEHDEDEISEIASDDKYVNVVGGSGHFIAITQKGIVYSWGDNFYKQASVSGLSGASKVFAGCNQSYVIGENNRLLKTFGLKGYLMGTDNLGRDIFARIVHGGRMTMTIGAVAVIISTIIAIIVGCLSGYFGGWVDMLLMRVTEIFSAIPYLPFAMMLSMVMRNYDISETGRIFIMMCILGALSWTGLAHMIRGQVLAEREKEFVIAAKAMGVKEGRIAFKHILPNVISVILVSVTLDFAGCMLTESSLSYLGFGVRQPQPTWGNMLNGSNNSIVIQNYWWQWVFPSLFLGIATICVNIIGDTLRDVMDPKSSAER